MEKIIQICGLITSVAAVATLFWKVFASIKAIKNGQMCLLRQQMLETYYHCLETKEIRQYRYQNFILSYEAYKALGGNSFIDHIKQEVEEFEVIS